MKQTSLPGFDDEGEDSPEGEDTRLMRPICWALKCPALFSCLPSPPSPSSLLLAGQTVWVIDSHSLIHQVFHALPEMTSPKGEPVGAVFGFTRDLLFLLEEKKPDYLFCAFDLPGKTFRHAMYDQYKIQRAEMPDDLVPQIPAIRRVIAALGIPALSCESFEADDVLATVARLTDELGGQCFLVTGDKDCRQLITDRVSVFNIRKNEVFDREMLRAEWGVSPEQVVDFQALVGDSVDNVPGVPLIGPKFARQLLEQFGTLEAVLDHADEVPGAKRKENLLKFRDQALLSRDLVRLDSHVPHRDRLERRSAGPDRSRCGVGVVSRLRFSQHRAEGGGAGEDYCVERTGRSGRGGDGERRETGRRSFNNRLRFRKGDESNLPFTAHLVDTPEAFETFLAQLRQQKSFSFDTETTDVRPRWAKLVGMSFAWNDREAWYLPLRSPEGQPHLDPVGNAGGIEADPRRPGDREDRAEPQVRHDRAPRGRGQLVGRGLRHHGRQLPVGSGTPQP